MINTYGVPRYQEINPAYLTIVTFPFMFGMMYGDIGHGSLLLVASFFMLAQGKNGHPYMAMARYMFFIMAICSFYCGWIYNEWFGIPLNIFGACYEINQPNSFSNLPDAKTKDFNAGSFYF
jgi:V-type H+-transporting ATPase subunit a